MPIVTESGFSHEAEAGYVRLDAPEAVHAGRIELPNDADASELAGRLSQLEKIRIPFPSSHDGRGFSLARRLRHLGYCGRLQAAGHVISDQFRYALACGFDEVAISDELAARQPEAHWRIEEAQRISYRDRLFGRYKPKAPIPSGVFAETVTEVEHYSDSLFRFRITRPASFRFQAGEFVMIGLPGAERPVFPRLLHRISPVGRDARILFDQGSGRAADRTSQGDPARRHGAHAQEGDRHAGHRRVSGGKRLWLLATGTGIAPFRR
ncbi:MAG: DUF934 domain-containing protein [Geminicoccaceae bacterium]